MKLAIVVALAACGGSAKPKPVPAATCEDATKHYEDAVDVPTEKRTRAHAAFVKRCTDDVWSVEARNCLAQMQPLDDARVCLAKLAPAQRAALDGDIASINRPPAPPRELTPCDQYKERIERMIKCEQLPQASRDALQQGYDAMLEAWAQLQNQPQEVQDQTQEACKAGVSALDSAMKELCPP